MIIPPNVLFCLNVKTILNKWKAITKWKVIAKWKEFSLTYLQLVGGVVEEKGKEEKCPAIQVMICNRLHKTCVFCVNLARNPLKVRFFFFKWQKNKNTSFMQINK